jgi:glucans biosynthesis protein C
MICQAAIGHEEQGRAYAYLNEASFPFYIFHFLPITVVAYFIARANANVWFKYILLVVVAYPATFGIYEIVRRIPCLRIAFGIKVKVLR